MVCKPKEEGGLGVLDLQKQNEALLMKNLDKFLNRRDIPWVTMVWEKHYPNGKLSGNTLKKAPFGGGTILKLFETFKSLSKGKCAEWSNLPFLARQLDAAATQV